MNKIVEEILWSIYYATSDRIGGYHDSRFIGLNSIISGLHNFTGEQLRSAVREISRQGLIEKKKYEDSVLVSLSEKGLLRAINYKFRRLNDKKEKWDGKWRMVSFDIPNSRQKGRKALVYRLKMGNFYKLQESVFLYPYDCQKEINMLVKLFKIENFVRFGLLDFIDTQEKIKNYFRLN